MAESKITNNIQHRQSLVSESLAVALEMPDVCPNIGGHSTSRLGLNASALLLSKRKRVAVFCTLFVLLRNLFHVKFRLPSVSARWVISNAGGYLSILVFFRTTFFSCHAYQIVVSRSSFFFLFFFFLLLQDNVFQLPCISDCCEPIFFFFFFSLLLQDNVFQLPCVPNCEPV